MGHAIIKGRNKNNGRNRKDQQDSENPNVKKLASFKNMFCVLRAL